MNQDQHTLLIVTRTFADGHVETDRHIWEGYTPAQAWWVRRLCRESGGGKWDAVDRHGLTLTITSPATGTVEVLRFTEYEPASVSVQPPTDEQLLTAATKIAGCVPAPDWTGDGQHCTTHVRMHPATWPCASTLAVIEPLREVLAPLYVEIARANAAMLAAVDGNAIIQKAHADRDHYADEARRLREGITELVDDWSEHLPGTEPDRVYGRQKVSVEYAVNALRVLVPLEADGGKG